MSQHCLEERAVEAVPIAAFAQHRQVNVEERHVEKDREDDEADGSGHEVFDGVEEGVAKVAENVPQLDDGEDADVEDHKETNKLDRDGPAQHRPGQGQPQPPGAGERGEAGAAELGHGEH